MGRNVSRILGCAGIALMMSLMAVAGPRPMSDDQLDAVYAAGFDVEIRMDMDLAASNPDALVLQGGDPEMLAQLFTSGIPLLRSAGTGRNTALIDPSGAYMPNLQNLTVNNINITGEALKGATTLLNIFALDGDVAVGLNLNVIVNPVGGTWNINQTNMNWANLLVSDALKTLGAGGAW